LHHSFVRIAPVPSLKVLPQYVLPKRALTELMGGLARTQGRAKTHAAIRWFVGRYGVDMGEAANPCIESYASFNDFFTRPLKAGARPPADADLLCPVDGAISQFGRIEADQIFQAKGHSYSTTALVGGDAKLAAQFRDGDFATLYLSPRDYHRIHMPIAGELKQMIYVPGDLFSVNPTTARGVPGLFARNERVVCVFESTHQGKRFQWVNTLVGATIVGSMATVWHGLVNPPRAPDVRVWNYGDPKKSPAEGGVVTLEKGAEMGRFLLGSTVVLLFPKGLVDFNDEWHPASAIRMGEKMAGWAAV
jgi:phosphatidylserine decarboxylase